MAHYTDGTVEDVTANAKFEPNDTEMAEVSTSGLVTARDLPGVVAVMARYQGQVAVFRASCRWAHRSNDVPSPRNFIDEAGVQATAHARDSTFVRVRRRHLLAPHDDRLAGRLPTIDEARQFLAEKDPAKRAKWIDTCWTSGELCRLLRHEVERHPAQQAA